MPQHSARPADEEIQAAVKALQGGAAPDAFEVIFRRFYRTLHTFFANRSALRDEADDLAQVTMSRAFEHIHLYRIEAESSFAAWLRTIAENVWKNAVRERQAAKRVPPREIAATQAENGEDLLSSPALANLAPGDPRPEPSPEEVLLARERTQMLRQAIASLPRGMRRCTELRLYSDLKYEQIASITGIGLNSVRSQLFEARKRLKPVLDGYFQGEDF
jgi:RNA polymerase sigma-70 factor (ECF subfamily)